MQSKAKYVDLRPHQCYPKIAFAIINPMAQAHYSAILKHFQPDEVDLIVHRIDKYPELVKWVYSQPFNKRQGYELLDSRKGYEVLVTEHYLDYLQPLPYPGYTPRSWAYLFRMFGQYNVRLMLGLGIDKWNLADWNHYFDAFMCLGPLQSEVMYSFEGNKLLTGYPRYDERARHPVDRFQLLTDLDLNPHAETILYLPAISSYDGTLKQSLHLMRELGKEYQVLIQAHPLVAEQDKEVYKVLQKLQGVVVINRDEADTAELMQCADFVIGDYGGYAFGAVYLDRPVLLLDKPGRNHEKLTNTDNWLRKYLPHIESPDPEQIKQLLHNQNYWQLQSQIRQQLRDILFTLSDEPAGLRAANQLRNILQERL